MNKTNAENEINITLDSEFLKDLKRLLDYANACELIVRQAGFTKVGDLFVTNGRELIDRVCMHLECELNLDNNY